MLARTGWSGEISYEIYLRDRSRGDELWEMVMEAGKPHNIAPATPSTIRSVEGGILSYASDIRREDNPFTLGFDRLVDLEQPADFIGKEALKRIKAVGVKRRLVGVEIGGPPLPQSNPEFWLVLDGARKIGHVTRCGRSPRLEKNIGLVNVPADKAAPGTRFTIDSSDERRPATVVPVPFVKSIKRIEH